WETIKQGKVWKGEIKNKSKTRKIFWLDTTIIPIFDASKKLTEFLAITKNITNRKDAEDKLHKQFIELEKTNEKLEKTNHELDKFVYRASHDLRAPLTSVLGLIDLTKSDKESTEIHKNLDMMKKSIDRLDQFVIDIINYYRNSRTVIKKEKIDFNKIISETFDDLLYLEGADQIKTKININEIVPYYSDISQLRVIFSNLISNAIKYCKPKINNSYIEVNVNATKDEVTIQVKDNGTGIDKKHIDKIFDMFFKNSNSTYSSGLGLYILKETVNKLDGTITVDSELNKGSKFTIRLPNK
ncbi:ATP-binding protein, partial [Bacteroidota bacterium]